MKKFLAIMMALVLVLGLSACAKKPAADPNADKQTGTTTENQTDNKTEEQKPEEPKDEPAPEPQPVVEQFSTEYDVKGSSYTGPFADTYIFEGETTDGVITKLNFDVIRDKGTPKEYSKKSIMGYVMNISDATIEKAEDALKLTLTCNGYDTRFGEGNAAQFMLSASTENLTPETTFGDLFVFSIAQQTPCPTEQAIIAYQYLATENGIEALTAETPVKDLLAKHGLFDGENFTEGTNRVSFAGFNGGRSYGEQLDAIVAYILANNMTLEDVAAMFKNENQATTPIEDRDAITGATISFTGEFQRMMEVVLNGGIFEGVVTHTENEGNINVEVKTQGFGGDVTTIVAFDAEKNVVGITVTEGNETDGIGAVLTADGSDFTKALIDGQDNVEGVDGVSGATITSNALKKAVQMAQEYVNGL